MENYMNSFFQGKLQIRLFVFGHSQSFCLRNSWYNPNMKLNAAHPAIGHEEISKGTNSHANQHTVGAAAHAATAINLARDTPQRETQTAQATHRDTTRSTTPATRDRDRQNPSWDPNHQPGVPSTLTLLAQDGAQSLY